jgi:zinc transport system substrate-binding protein
MSRRVLLGAAGVLLLASGCVSSPGTGSGTSVVASFYPIAEAAERVGGAHVSVTNLTAPGVEPHDLELTPRDLQDVATADVVLYLGGGFQPSVQDAVGDATGLVADVASGLRTRSAPPAGSEASLSADPHVWLDPVLYGRLVGEVLAALRTADPGDSRAFEANARAFEAQISALDADYRTGLSSCERDVIVTSHAAFGYLAARYGLRQEAISGLAPEAEPTPQRLAQLEDLVRRLGVTTIFTEELVSPKVADTLAAETGATTAVLNPLESLTPAESAAGQDYLSVMRSNLSKLEVALGCG